jgi:hypothetical protein
VSGREQVRAEAREGRRRALVRCDGVGDLQQLGAQQYFNYDNGTGLTSATVLGQIAVRGAAGATKPGAAA